MPKVFSDSPSTNKYTSIKILKCINITKAITEKPKWFAGGAMCVPPCETNSQAAILLTDFQVGSTLSTFVITLAITKKFSA